MVNKRRSLVASVWGRCLCFCFAFVCFLICFVFVFSLFVLFVWWVFSRGIKKTLPEGGKCFLRKSQHG